MDITYQKIEKRKIKKNYEKEYRAWLRMKTACYNKKNCTYKTYGARGIHVHENWKSNFKRFLTDMGECPEDCTGIDLIDINKDFCKHNCRWVNAFSRRRLKDMPNQKNKRSNSTYDKPKRFTITVEQDYFDYIQRQAIEKSRQLKQPISAVSLIKMVLNEAIPMPKQLEMFNQKK